MILTLQYQPILADISNFDTKNHWQMLKPTPRFQTMLETY